MESSTVTIRSLPFWRSVTVCSMDRQQDVGEDEGLDVDEDEGENAGRRSINSMTAVI